MYFKAKQKFNLNRRDVTFSVQQSLLAEVSNQENQFIKEGTEVFPVGVSS